MVISDTVMQKNRIVLSSKHPSFLEDILPSSTHYAPIVLNQDLVLVDGYRRYRMVEKPELLAVQLKIQNVFSAAFEMNRNTREWDEIDEFFWLRWAQSLGSEHPGLPKRSFPTQLSDAPDQMLSALANRKLQLGQAIRILEAPSGTWPFFIQTLSSSLKFNVNETAHFIDLTFDLANRWQIRNLSDVFHSDRLNGVWSDERLNLRKKGEALLKAMRSLRYPLYQRKTEELSTAWANLNLERWQAKTSQFLDRGILEVTIRARTHEDMSKQVTELYESLHSPLWNDIWKP